MMAYEGDAFHILEIELTDDERIIKKAYASLVKKYHPEEQPEKWKEIHDAYIEALQIIEQGQHIIPVSSISSASDSAMSGMPESALSGIIITQTESTENLQEKTGWQDAETGELNFLFENIEEISDKQQKQKEELLKEALQPLIETLKQMSVKNKLDQREWEVFFGRKDILLIISQKEFLYQLGDSLLNKKIDAKLCQFLKEQLKEIEEYIEDRSFESKNMDISEALGYAEKRINAAHWANIESQAKKQYKSNRITRVTYVIAGAVIAVILMTALIFFSIVSGVMV